MAPLKNGESCSCGYNSANYVPAPHQLVPGSVLQERYLVGRVLGEGGFGITYVGRDLKLGLKIAIKEYYPAGCASRTSGLSHDVYPTYSSQESFERGKEKFLREAKTMGMLDRQPHIVGVKDFFEENNTAYIVMEYVEGTTLKALTAERGGRIQATELLEMMKPMFKALSTMHETGLIHRDISPDNLMLENGSLKLLDFGCAKDISEGSETQTITLKHGYAPLEQYQRSGQGPWTDVYALAASIYYCLTGVAPPRATDRITDDEIVSPNKYGAGLTFSQERAIMKALSVRSRDRYQSVDAFASALYNEKPADKPKKQGSSKLVPVLIVLIGLILAGMVIAVWVNISGNSDKNDRGTTPATTTAATTKKQATTTTSTTTTEVSTGSRVLDKDMLYYDEYFTKANIVTVSFLTSTSSAPNDAWDFSRDEDGSVLAWVDDDNNLYVAANGGVKTASDASYLLYQYTSLKSVDLSGLDTSDTTNMYAMFGYCSSLTSLDVSSLDTSNVTDMRFMFLECNSLTSLNLNGMDTSNVEGMNSMFKYCTSLKSLDLSSFDTSNVTTMQCMFDECFALTSIKFGSNFDTSSVTDMSYMFYKCEKLTSIDISGFDTSNVTTMIAMFDDCLVLTSIKFGSDLDTSNVTDMSYMFYKCEALASLDLSGFDTSSVTTMYAMFSDCFKLTSIKFSNSFNTANVTNMSFMFNKCEALTSLGLSSFNTANVTDMSSMFYKCSSLTSLDLSSFATSKVTNMYCMFSSCSSLTSIDVSSFNTSKVENMGFMFGNCSAITAIELSNFNTAKVTSMNGMFCYCSKLTSLDLSNFDTSKVTDMSNMFISCYRLEELILPDDFGSNAIYTGAMYAGTKYE